MIQYNTNPVGSAIADFLGDGSVTEFAHRMGRARITIYRWLSGQRSPSMTELPKLAKSLGCSPAALADKIAQNAERN